MSSYRTPGPVLDYSGIRANSYKGSIVGTTVAAPQPIPGPLVCTRRELEIPESDADKLLLAAYRALPLLPENIRERVADLLTPESMAVIAGVAVVWGGSHFFGVGEVIDVILAGVAVVTIGWDMIKAMRSFYSYYEIAIRARTDADIENAAKSFADAVVTVAGAIGWARLASWLGSARGGKLRSGGIIASDASRLKRWRVFIDGIDFKVPRDRGMLWSKLGKDPIKFAKEKGLVSLETELQRFGFQKLYDREFGSTHSDTTKKIWEMVSERYAQSLEGKVTAYVNRSEHFKKVSDVAKKAHGAALTKAEKTGEFVPSLHEFEKTINFEDPVFVKEVREISEVLLKNNKITELIVLDSKTGEVFGYRTKEVLEALQRLEARSR